MSEGEPNGEIVKSAIDMFSKIQTGRRTIVEIQSTGDSTVFGRILSEFDALARLDMQGGLTEEQQSRFGELDRSLADSFGIMGDAVLQTWLEAEEVRGKATHSTQL